MHILRKIFVSFLDLTFETRSRFEFEPRRLLSTGTFSILALHCIKLCCMDTGDAYSTQTHRGMAITRVSLTRGVNFGSQCTPRFFFFWNYRTCLYTYRDLHRNTTAIILGAALTFPFLAHISKATDANVTRSNWPKHCHNCYSQHHVVCPSLLLSNRSLYC